MAGKFCIAASPIMFQGSLADSALRGFQNAQGRLADGIVTGYQSANGADVEAPHRVSPAEQCTFPAAPEEPYYWDPNCTSADVSLGCWADGVHAECRFCGESPYLGIPCPTNAVVPSVAACRFANEPTTSAYWEPTCYIGMKGCYADGENVGCRFCGDGNYSDIPCPPAVCDFVNEPYTPYYWDPSCHRDGESLGCHADGVHPECRFCDKVPFQSVPCPESARPAYGFKECWFPHGSGAAHYWDEDCEWGTLGCWADGVNAQCRFCGSGAYSGIPCPSTTAGVVTNTSNTTDSSGVLSTTAVPQDLLSTTESLLTDTSTPQELSSTSRSDNSQMTTSEMLLSSTTDDFMMETTGPPEQSTTSDDTDAETTAFPDMPIEDIGTETSAPQEPPSTTSAFTEVTTWLQETYLTTEIFTTETIPPEELP